MGVNDYPNPTDATGNPFKDENGKPVDNKLSGCVNDAKAYYDLLQKKYGVKAANLKMMADKEVTGEKFVDAVRWLVQSAKSGDHVFFQFSGHGSQIDNKEKASGKQSVIVLQDMRLVTSDFFKELGPLLRNAGISSTFLFDSCFAGGMSKPPATLNEILGLDSMGVMFKKGLKIRPGKNRYLLPKNMVKAQMALANKLAAVSQTVKARSMAGTEATTCFIFASKDNQTSSDVSGPNMQAHGLFTLVLNAVLSEEPALPIGDTVSAIAELLDDKGFTQTPNAEATSADRINASFLPL
ncbi:MAG: caspase family protein [Chthonomonas sp.]|nr:caspase family protein [Chthonomonas sp.]